MAPSHAAMLKLSQTGNCPQKLYPDFHYCPPLRLEHAGNHSTGRLMITDELKKHGFCPFDMVGRLMLVFKLFRSTRTTEPGLFKCVALFLLLKWAGCPQCATPQCPPCKSHSTSLYGLDRKEHHCRQRFYFGITLAKTVRTAC